MTGARPTPRRTGLIWDEWYLWHHPGGGAGVLAEGAEMIEPGDFGEETPHPRRRLRNLIEVSGLGELVEWVRPRAASEEELARVHALDYVRRIEMQSALGGGDAGGGSPFTAAGSRIARLAAGGVLTAVEHVVDGRLDNAYALVKPPGHHASADTGNGHCLFNNVAVAARHAQEVLGIERVSIVDWDVHWGNGTQSIFWTDPSVQVISLHQDDWYPRGGGRAGELGEGDGRGAHVNVPLPPGSGSGAYADAFARVVLPALHRHEPELILVSCGFDASAADPSGRMLLTSADFRAMTRWIVEAADELCRGRVVACHEGGYAPAYVPFCGHAVLEELLGVAPLVEDPFAARYGAVGYCELQVHQSAAIDEVLRFHPGLVGLRSGR